MHLILYFSGGGGAGTPGVPGNLNTGTSICEGGEGGDGIYLGNIGETVLL